MNRQPAVGELVCDCRFKHVKVTKVSDLPDDDDVELEDGFHCSWVHCLDEVPHDWEHPETPEEEAFDQLVRVTEELGLYDREQP